ncbi:hypothetical protein BS50DRAFT_203404 [Corynespora cassiicola Philippines]|uniref:Uncharacterized protein n=1 Tax=Corynespora cassiicola Philippines TaxID=1448308 RepID=A0A2T2N5L0_CORCC|nr:hypothetical protein BS50DRAFT_203404 [Corynespora cassiicola Philippines]
MGGPRARLLACRSATDRLCRQLPRAPVNLSHPSSIQIRIHERSSALLVCPHPSPTHRYSSRHRKKKAMRALTHALVLRSAMYHHHLLMCKPCLCRRPMHGILLLNPVPLDVYS